TLVHRCVICGFLTFCLSAFSIVRPLNATYTVSLHDALPISKLKLVPTRGCATVVVCQSVDSAPRTTHVPVRARRRLLQDVRSKRSEEHTSELQSRFDLVCRLLLEETTADRSNLRSH